MRKKIAITFLFLLSIFFYLAVEKVGAGEVSVCLVAKRCREENTDCSGAKYGQYEPGHRAKLTLDPNKEYPINTDIEIYEHIITDEGEIPTRGDPTEDAFSFLTALDDKSTKDIIEGYSYQFEGLFQSDGNTVYSPTYEQTGVASPQYKTIQITDAGNFYIVEDKQDTPWLEWQDSTRPGTDRVFKIHYMAADPPPDEPLEDEYGTGGLQEGDTEPNPDANTEEDTDCVMVSWDPAGRVFDSRSLEPIPQTAVKIYKRAKDSSIFTPVSSLDTTYSDFINPYLTIADGKFSFYVRAFDDPPNYLYKLEVIPSSMYIFPVMSEQDIHPNANIIYSEIYPLKSKIEPPAKDSWEIVENKNEIEYRDIPLKPNDGIGKKYDLMVMSYIEKKEAVSGKYNVKITYSHPFTKAKPYVILLGETEKIYQPEIYADKDGKVTVQISADYAKTVDRVGVEGEKVDLTGSLSNLQSLKTLPTDLKLEIIPSNLAGYAYNSNGSIIPNALVTISLKYSNKAYCQVKADDKGFFRIGSNCLPNSPYVIRFTAPTGNKIKIAPAKFIQQNSDYILKNNINFNSIADSQGRPITIQPKPTNRSLSPNINKPEVNKPANNIIIIIVILVVLVFGVVTIVGVYLYRKNHQPSPF